MPEFDDLPLTEADLAPDPLDLFINWFEEWGAAASEIAGEPAAMVLATAGADGRPLARNVLLRGVDRAGFVWFTNYESRKGRNLAENPHACLVFTWVGRRMRRQVIVTGPVERISGDESDAYWATRPRRSQLAAWASDQSRVIPDRSHLERRFAEAGERFPVEVRRPPHWGGFRLVPEAAEFWQGRPDRLHDRLVYSRQTDDDGSGNPRWRVERLAP
ncbi:MAG: pyridoxamine 5'-phosphate oxidase [Acidimicrobiales bacterium]